VNEQQVKLSYGSTAARENGSRPVSCPSLVRTSTGGRSANGRPFFRRARTRPIGSAHGEDVAAARQVILSLKSLSTVNQLSRMQLLAGVIK
jgi:hypothetical protein